jgi:hypothetical protein
MSGRYGSRWEAVDSITVMQHCDFDALLEDSTVIEGGHYVIGDEVDDVALWTWKRAVALYRVACRRGLRDIGLTLLVEDFRVPAEDRAAFRQSYEIPTVHHQVLAELGVAPHEVGVVWEVQLRNRAHGDLRRRLKAKLTEEPDGYYLPITAEHGRQVTEGTTPVCNFLMARHFADKDARYALSINFHDYRWECQANGGVVVSRVLYETKITVYNAYAISSLDIGFVVKHQRSS